VHLSALRIRGFKSFPEQIELRFFPGVAVIVGPNGSGKSNISDSLQWAMAASAPSAIRAHASTDVLFAGTDARPAAGLCEVELVLDNSDGTIALPQAEISVMRRLHRDGTSEYLLGRRAVRRLEVQEALADAGIGRDLHCVISQGSVDEVLLARPEERRALIEEAAGLGKYQRRRRRARARLGRVRADLERASDIEREIQRRLRPLALQATAAERAELIGREAAVLRLRLLASESAAARRRRAALAAERDGAGRARLVLSQASAATRTRREQAEGELAGLAAEQERASARAWGLASSLERLSDRRTALAERLGEAAREAEREARGAFALEQESGAARADAARAADDAAKLVAQAEHVDPRDDTALAAATTRAEDALERALAARRSAGDAEAAAQRARAEVERMEARVETLSAELATLATRDATAQAALGPLELAVAEAAPRAAEARERLSAAEARRTATTDELDRLRTLEGERRVEAGASAARLAGAEARARTLEAAVARGDGLGPVVKLLAGRASLAHELVEPEPGLEAAVAAVLARRAGTAVAADLDEALELLGDREMEGASVGVPHGRPAAGKAGRGLEPLSAHCVLVAGAPADLLDGAWLADDLDALRGVRSGIAVTREGLGYDADLGVAFRGGAAGQADALAARRELGEAQGEIRDATRASERAGALLHEVSRARAAYEQQAQAATAEARASSAAVDACERQDRVARDAHERARTDAARISERRLAADAETVALRAAAVQAGEEAAALEAAAAVASERASSTDSAHQVAAAERATLASAAAERRAQAAALRERARAAGDEAERRSMAAERSEIAARGARARSEVLAALAGRADHLDALLAGCAAAGERARQPAAESVRSFERRAAELSAELAACGAEEAAREADLRAADAKATALEIEHAQLDERLSELRRRTRELAEQHEIDVVDAVEPLAADEVTTLSAKLERLERRRAELGAVNPLAREQYEEERARSEDVTTQIADLQQAVGELDGLIADLSSTIDERFTATYSQVEQGFSEAIEILFPGGRGRLTLRAGETPEAADEESLAQEPGEPGIELEVHPRGKRLTSLDLLSGGERALAALAFLFALAFARPCPFYVLDEVDAALDDANIERFLELVDRERARAQFVIITHQKRTMDVADVLYGVSMAGDGISRVLSRKVPRSDAALVE
jgi:chromosome segregation protein